MSKKDLEIELEIVSQSKSSKTTTSTAEVKRDIKQHFDQVKKVNKKVAEKANRLIKEKQEANRLVSLANKRLRRLEEKGYTNSPAYQATNGYFSVKGKTPTEVQALIREMNKFINAKTSTVRGVNAYAKEMANNTGLKYKNLKDLQAKIPKFFELTSKVEQYLRNIEDIASAINYNQIWEQVNVYVKDNQIDLSQAKGNIDGMIKHISDALKEYDKSETVLGTTFRLKK